MIKSMIERVEEMLRREGKDLLNREEEEENKVEKEKLKNILIRMNGFQ